MNVLAFDTSSSVLSVSVQKASDELSETKLVGFLKHAENLLPMIDDLLSKEALTLEKIDVFLIGRGPGSFTGLRIGFATLKGLIALKKKPCFGALSLDMIAENADLPDASRLGVCLDARREKIYVKFYRRTNGQWLGDGESKVLTFLEFAEATPDEIYFSGDALKRYGKEIRKACEKKKIHFLPENVWHPKASTLIHWYHDKTTRHLQQLEKPEDFIPLYFRLSEAEENKKA